MDFNDTPEENDFRLEVRDWLKNNAPKEKKAGGYDSIDVQESALARARDWQAKKLKQVMLPLLGQKSMVV